MTKFCVVFYLCFVFYLLHLNDWASTHYCQASTRVCQHTTQLWHWLPYCMLCTVGNSGFIPLQFILSFLHNTHLLLTVCDHTLGVGRMKRIFCQLNLITLGGYSRESADIIYMRSRRPPSLALWRGQWRSVQYAYHLGLHLYFGFKLLDERQPFVEALFS